MSGPDCVGPRGLAACTRIATGHGICGALFPRAMRAAGKATDAGTVLGEDAREGIKLILAKLKKGEQSGGQEKRC